MRKTMNNTKNLFAGSIGTLVEWAEFCFYGYMISQFSHLFFPMLSKNSALIAAFGTFAISYLARPLGSLLFGYMGDRWGRKRAFSGSILLMCFATLGIGLLPTYPVIGSLAPTLLVLLRFLQGLAVAGEYPGSSIFILEQESSHSYYASSWIATAGAGGMLIGGLAAVIVSLPQMPDWAWRVPFCLSFFSCFIGFYIRRRLSETEQFAQLVTNRQIETTPIRTVCKTYPQALLKTAALAAFVAIFVYVCNVWWLSFVIEKEYFSPFIAHSLATLTLCWVTVCTPLMGALADRWRGKMLMKLGMVGDIITVPLLFYASTSGSFIGMLGVSLLYAVSHAALTAPMFRYFADLFPTQIRYSGQSIGWNISVALFGSSAPLLAQLLVNHNFLLILVLYVMLSGVIALWINIGSKEQKYYLAQTQ